MNKQDPFGIHKNQAEAYDLDRPRYPKEFIDIITKNIIVNQNYLDVATGTGILLYELYDKFQGSLVANDISTKQLKVAEKKAKELGLESRFQFIESDAFEIKEKLKKPTRFDLITIGQALHWLDVDKFVNYVKNDLLSDDGVFVVTGYFCDGFDYNFPFDPDFALSGQKIYDEYYATVKPYFYCDRDALDKGHSDFNFKKYFSHFERFDCTVRTELPIEKFVNFLGTASAYNVYRNKFGTQQDYVDPVQKANKAIRDSLDQYYVKKGILAPEKPVVMKMHFFLNIMSNGMKAIKRIK